MVQGTDDVPPMSFTTGPVCVHVPVPMVMAPVGVLKTPEAEEKSNDAVPDAVDAPVHVNFATVGFG